MGLGLMFFPMYLFYGTVAQIPKPVASKDLQEEDPNILIFACSLGVFLMHHVKTLVNIPPAQTFLQRFLADPEEVRPRPVPPCPNYGDVVVIALDVDPVHEIQEETEDENRNFNRPMEDTTGDNNESVNGAMGSNDVDKVKEVYLVRNGNTLSNAEDVPEGRDDTQISTTTVQPQSS